MAKLTKKQQASIITLSKSVNHFQAFGHFASKALREDDWNEYVDCRRHQKLAARRAVKTARDLGLSEEQIREINVTLIPVAESKIPQKASA